jgi:gliding motility-associated-like protein
MIDTTACNSPDTSYRQVSIHGFNVVASFTLPDSICKGQTIKPGSTITNGTTITWDFGDGGVASSDTAEHTFDSVGTFTVRVIVTNPASCNGADTFTRVIKVLDAPFADFSFTPITPETNTPNTFRNLSIDAIRYLWDFGDGSTSTEVNPVRQFRRTGTYNVCLTAYNTGGCPATKCRKLSAEIIPIVGLPTGFSPNGDGDNDILYVRGAAIESMDLKIYNRWGQVVFHSTSQRDGWDGTFNGQPQPIEAYGFVLNVTFIDGSTKLLKGNITVIR